MRYGIIGGTGVYKVNGIETEEKTIDTQYGEAKVYLGLGNDQDLVFLTRHGVDHSIPPHKINFRANIAALKKLGVESVLATYCVGSVSTLIPPCEMVVLDQFIDLAPNRISTFFQGGEYGLAHTDVTEPYCSTLSKTVLEIAREKDFHLLPDGTYVCFNGPRFETAAEIRMAAQMGGDVVGMTAGTETALARDAGLHFAAVAFSINYGAGLKQTSLQIDKTGLSEKLDQLMGIFAEALRNPFKQICGCDSAVMVSQEPKIDLFA